MKTVNGIVAKSYAVIDTKIYTIYLINTERINGKILLYLKNKFSVPLSEIKNFSSQPQILLTQGDWLTVSKERQEVERIGGKVKIVAV